MTRISIVDNQLISVWAYPERRMIHHQAKGYCFGDDFREALSRGVEAMQRYQATKWLSDNRTGSALTPEDGQWATDVWFPQAKAAGWRHWAVVQPAKILGQANLGRFVKQYTGQGLNVRVFADPHEAMRWLDAA